MFRKPLVRGFALAVIAALVLLGTAAAVVCHWVKIDADSRQSQDVAVLAKLLGWKVTDGGPNDFAQQVAHNPLPVLQLLTHDSHRLRRRAEQMLLYRSNITDGLDDKLLNAISAELVERSAYDKPALVRILAKVGDRGVNRLMLLYRSKLPVAPRIHEEICSEVRRAFSRHKLIEALLSVANDDAVPLENRCLAVEALGFMRKPDTNRSTTKAEQAAINELTGLLPQLPERAANAARASLLQIERYATDRDEDYYPGDGHVVSPAKDGGADALAALKDKTDWLRVGQAAEKLARHGMKQAIPELQRVATTHWYGPVRKTAQQAIRVLQGQEPALLAYDGSRWSSLVMKFENEEPDAWRKDHPPIPPPPKNFPDDLLETVTEKLKPARQALFWRLQPRITNVEYHVPGRLPVLGHIDDFGMNPMKPRHAIRFAGGKLLGYDEGEFGAGTVFYRKGETPLRFGTSAVEGFVRMPFGVLVVCDMYYTGEGHLFLATETENHQVSVTYFLRLPHHTYSYQLLSSGELLLRGIPADHIISTSGEIRLAEKPAK